MSKNFLRAIFFLTSGGCRGRDLPQSKSLKPSSKTTETTTKTTTNMPKSLTSRGTAASEPYSRDETKRMLASMTSIEQIEYAIRFLERKKRAIQDAKRKAEKAQEEANCLRIISDATDSGQLTFGAVADDGLVVSRGDRGLVSAIEVERNPDMTVTHRGVTCDASGQKPIRGPRCHKEGDDYDVNHTEFWKLSLETCKNYLVYTHPGRDPWDTLNAPAIPGAQYRGSYGPFWSTDGSIKMFKSRSPSCVSATLYEHIRYVLEKERRLGNEVKNLYVTKCIWDKANPEEQAKVLRLKRTIVVYN